MTKKDFFLKMDQILEKAPGTINGGEVLEAEVRWDSMAAIAFIAMVDSSLNMQLSPSELVKSRTVADLLALVGDKVKD